MWTGGIGIVTSRVGGLVDAPGGVMLHHVEGDQAVLLTCRGGSGPGYGKALDGPRMDQGQAVEVLTPRTVVEVIGAGYVPELHGAVGG